MYTRFILWCVIAALGSLPLYGHVRGSDERIEIRKLSLAPAAEPVPALFYILLPRRLDQKPGNAALLYNSAAALCPDGKSDDIDEKIGKWRDMPVEQLPRKEVEKALSSFSSSFHHVALAAQRSDCQWEMPLEDGFSLQLPHLSTFRRIAFAMQLQIRLKIADGQTDQAVELLQQGLYMGRSIARGPTIIQDLVGASISRLMLEEVESLMQMPDSPNLYWALTSLPTPMIDMRSSLEYEREMLFMELPVLRNLENEVLTPAQASATISYFIKKLGGPGDLPFEGALPLGWVMMHYSDAKQFLAQRGFSQQRIEEMPAAQAVLIYQKQEYQELLDNIYKWLALPYHQAQPHLEKGRQQFYEHLHAKGVKVNVFSTFMPALGRISFLLVRLDRKIALLRTMEAIRMFAADHSGRLPRSLAEITSVPVPADPVTGKNFLYKRINARNARLEATVSPAERKKRPVYELTIKP